MSLYSQDHIKILRAFANEKVRFMLIGGLAAIYYGVRRNTGDLDILVEPTEDNGIKIIKALRSIDLELPEIKPEEFKEKLVLSFGLEPDAVDILNYTPGIEFNIAYQNSHTIEFNGILTRIIDIDDLIKNKENLNRPGEKSLLDKYDAEVLKKIRKNKKEE